MLVTMEFIGTSSLQGWFVPFDNRPVSTPLSWLLCAGGARIVSSTGLLQGSRCQPVCRLTCSHFVSSGFKIASSSPWITYHHLAFPVRVVSCFLFTCILSTFSTSASFTIVFFTVKCEADFTVTYNYGQANNGYHRACIITLM